MSNATSWVGAICAHNPRTWSGLRRIRQVCRAIPASEFDFYELREVQSTLHGVVQAHMEAQYIPAFLSFFAICKYHHELVDLMRERFEEKMAIHRELVAAGILREVAWP